MKTWCVLTISLHKLIKTHHVLFFLLKKWSKNGPKTAPRRAQDGPRFRSHLGSDFWPIFDPILEPFFGHFWDRFWHQLRLLHFSMLQKDAWRNRCTRTPLRTLLRPILERLGPPPRRQDPENSRWNWRCAFPLCEPSSRPLYSDFGPILAPLNIANKLPGGAQEGKNRSKRVIFGTSRKRTWERIQDQFAPDSGRAKNPCKN